MDDSCDLLQQQRSAGGVVWEADLPLARVRPGVLHFGDPAAEIRAARELAVVFDLSDRVHIELNGRDARNFLHRFCTNNVQRLEPGQGCEAFITNVKGRIVAHVLVFARDDSVWIDSPPIDESMLLNHFDRYLFSEDVRLRGHSRDLSELYVAGAECLTRLEALGIPAESIGMPGEVRGMVEGIPVATRRYDFWNTPGCLLVVERRQQVRLWRYLIQSGIQAAGAWAFHALRIEAAFPWHGIDLSVDNLAQEADRTEHAICFTKGCYLGQEPIARLDALGHVNRRLARLRVITTAFLPADAEVHSPGGGKIGNVSSSVPLPGTDHAVALAMLKVSHGQSGTELQVRCGEACHRATVC